MLRGRPVARRRVVGVGERLRGRPLQVEVERQRDVVRGLARRSRQFADDHAARLDHAQHALGFARQRVLVLLLDARQPDQIALFVAVVEIGLQFFRRDAADVADQVGGDAVPDVAARRPRVGADGAGVVQIVLARAVNVGVDVAERDDGFGIVAIQQRRSGRRASGAEITDSRSMQRPSSGISWRATYSSMTSPSCSTINCPLRS